MKRLFLSLFAFFVLTGVCFALDSGWVKCTDSVFINTSVDNYSVDKNKALIKFYSKNKVSELTVNGQNVDETVSLNVLDCSDIIKTKELSTFYYSVGKLISTVNLDVTTSWDYYSPDDERYKVLQGLCKKNFK